MNYATLTLALIFAAGGFAFARAARSPEPSLAQNKRTASILMFVAAAGFAIATAATLAFGISMVRK